MKKILFLSILFFSCNESDEDVAQTVNKDGSIEVIASTKHLTDSTDESRFLIRYYKSGKEVKFKLVIDTIPALGKTIETVENDEGEEQTVMLPKEYTIFVTLK